MIEPPLPPEKPVSPNRIMIIVAGLILSLGAGIGAAVLRDTMDPSVRGFGDVRQLLTVPPLASIPTIVTLGDRQRGRLKTLYAWAGSVVGLSAALCLVHFFYRPLDVLWITLLRRFGV